MTTAVKAPTTAYAEHVVAGDVLTGRLVNLACQRHLDDLEHGSERGLRFDEDKAKRILDFFSWLQFAEGEHAGEVFKRQPWQEFIAGSLFGWVEANGARRFRNAYIEIGKGNGKTPMAAAFGLYGLVADGEASAEIYTAGVTREQANYILADADKMVSASTQLQRVVHQSSSATKPNLSVKASNSYMRAVSSEARTLDQKRVHIAVIDEIHEHRTDEVVNKLIAGMKGRRQPMIIEITNSGHDRTTICWFEII